MKPEPLKGKRINRRGINYYYHTDIKSAVEWLKYKIQPNALITGNKEKTALICDVQQIIDLIDKAFEDVVK